MNVFNKIRVKKPSKSTFDLSHDVKLSMKMGKLVPCYLQEVVPGDKIYVKQEAMFRMMPMLAPIMHKVDIYFHTFFCPNRILWPNWEKFITGGEADGTIPPALPIMDSIEVTASSLANYLGLPLTNLLDKADVPISALPFAAYQRIYHEYYRDENLQTADPISLHDGPQTSSETAALTVLQNRSWEHDYFTSALPFAQKGDAVEIPIDLQGSVELDTTLGTPSWKNVAGGGINPLATIGTDTLDEDSMAYDGPVGVPPTTRSNAFYDPEGTLVFSDDASTTTTINDLRTAFSLQKWLEKNARAGSRYVESLLAHFGVRSSDKRFQRPEYIGGSKATMAISEVLQTSATATGSATPQANMAGHGISVTADGGHSFFCEEHGYIMTILSIRPKTAYYQGVPRHFQKADRSEYYWPDFAMLGEQEIKNNELYYVFGDPTNNDTFGYIPRYTEYRYNPSRVAGQVATTLDFWHMGRKFSLRPFLNAGFIKCEPDKRIYADIDPNDDEVVAHIYNQVMAQRPIPFYGSPGSI